MCYNLENEACNIGSPETLVRPLHTAFGVFWFPAVKGLGLEGFRREVRGSGPGLRLKQPHRPPKLDKKVELVVLPGERCRVLANKKPYTHMGVSKNRVIRYPHFRKLPHDKPSAANPELPKKTESSPSTTPQ